MNDLYFIGCCGFWRSLSRSPPSQIIIIISFSSSSIPSSPLLSSSPDHVWESVFWSTLDWRYNWRSVDWLVYEFGAHSNRFHSIGVYFRWTSSILPLPLTVLLIVMMND